MWQPIETAPKDGTSIWLFCPNDEPQQAAGFWANDPNGPYWAFCEQLVMDVVGQAFPTHWQPLPEPPAE